MMFSGGNDARRWSSERRESEQVARIFLIASVVLAASGFFCGYAWQSKKTKAPTTVEARPADSVAHEAALTALDEAITAKYEKRIAGALSALDRARRADPSVPGIDVAFAEVALNEKQFIEMRAAAGAARKKSDHAAGASVLLGMDKWINRGASDREMSSAADAASAHFAEATEADYFHAPAWFFWGDVLRYAGREDEGWGLALAALHRFNPWDSSDAITAKIVFSSTEAGDSIFNGFGVDDGSPLIQAASDLADATTPDGAVGLSALAPYAARQTLTALSNDSFFRLSRPSSDGPSNFPRLP